MKFTATSALEAQQSTCHPGWITCEEAVAFEEAAGSGLVAAPTTYQQSGTEIVKATPGGKSGPPNIMADISLPLQERDNLYDKEKINSAGTKVSAATEALIQDMRCPPITLEWKNISFFVKNKVSESC